MKAKNIFGFFAATIALVFLATVAIPNVNAAECDPGDKFACINEVIVNGIEFEDFDPTPTAAVFAGEVIPVRVIFTANDNIGNDSDITSEEDVRVIARILGEPGLSDITGEFDVLEGNTYSMLLNIELPFDIDPSEDFILEITVESNREEADSVQISLEIQRSDNELEILFVEITNEVRAGENLVIDLAIVNRGRDEAENTRVRASIPELGIVKTVFIGDLSPEDEADPDKEDSIAARIFLLIPSDAPAGLYNVEIEAFNSEALTVTTKKVVIVGVGEDSTVISASTSKTFGTGQEVIYSITIVNAGNTIAIYELTVESPSGLTVTAEESVLAVPAGSSRTVKLRVMASEEGTYNFAVNVQSTSGQLVKRESFVANVEGATARPRAGNAAIVLTIILAIIFVVLLIVLIVLLTKKPEKPEEFGESYY